ncbi:MAG: hypothetical protein RLZZ524_494, partial [Pseudomonadota bacterium]
MRGWIARRLPTERVLRHWLGQFLMVGCLALAGMSLAWLLLPAVRSHDSQTTSLGNQAARATGVQDIAARRAAEHKLLRPVERDVPIAVAPAPDGRTTAPGAQAVTGVSPASMTNHAGIPNASSDSDGTAPVGAVGSDAAPRLKLGLELAEQGRDAEAID